MSVFFAVKQDQVEYLGDGFLLDQVELTDASQTESEISIYLKEKNIAPAFEQRQDIIKETITAYNAQRPHGSLDFLPPLQAHEQTGILKKRWKNYKKQQAPDSAIEAVN